MDIKPDDKLIVAAIFPANQQNHLRGWYRYRGGSAVVSWGRAPVLKSAAVNFQMKCVFSVIVRCTALCQREHWLYDFYVELWHKSSDTQVAPAPLARLAIPLVHKLQILERPLYRCFVKYETMCKIIFNGCLKNVFEFNSKISSRKVFDTKNWFS